MLAESSKESTLVVRNLSCAFEGFALEASFHVEGDERVALFAPSGTGKSTLLRAIAGLETGGALQGEVLLGPVSFSGVPPEQRNLGVVFQESLLFPQMTILENVAYPLKLRKVGRKEREALARQWLERVELKGHESKFPQDLSGGERQRVALARALIFGPSAVLLDEPFSALDFRLRARLSTLLTELHGEARVPLLFVTHDFADRDRLATRVLQYRPDEDLTRHRFVD